MFHGGSKYCTEGDKYFTEGGKYFTEGLNIPRRVYIFHGGP